MTDPQNINFVCACGDHPSLAMWLAGVTLLGNVEIQLPKAWDALHSRAEQDLGRFQLCSPGSAGVLAGICTQEPPGRRRSQENRARGLKEFARLFFKLGYSRHKNGLLLGAQFKALGNLDRIEHRP